MVGFAGRISVEGDADIAADLVDVAIKHADKLRAWKTTSGTDSIIRAYDLGGGYYTVVADLQNMRAIHMVTPSSTSERTFDTMTTDSAYSENVGVIDVISGKVGSPIIDRYVWDAAAQGANNSPAEDGTFVVEVGLPDGSIDRRVYSSRNDADDDADETDTQEEVEALRSFTPTTPTAERYTDAWRRIRLAVPENPIFQRLTSLANFEIVYSEHAHSLPTQYTGAMRRVVQLLLGIGKVLRPTYEEKWTVEKKRSMLGNKQRYTEDGPLEEVRSAFDLFVPNAKTRAVRVDFDYRFAKTHGITFDNQNKPWVVEISTRGVHVMPLYMDPVSQTVNGRQRYIDVSPELTDFFDEFNGMPLGITMPTGDEFSAMKRAGEVVELVGQQRMSEFYSKGAYCSEHGWVFDERGKEAHNTCWDYTAAALKQGHVYGININVAGDNLPDWNPTTRALAANFTELWKQKKARRMTLQQASDVLLTYVEKGKEEGDKAFDAVVVNRTVSGTGNLSPIRTGPLYHPARPNYQPQIKFPEPLISGLLSFDFRPGEDYRGGAVKCDTTMFCCRTDNGLEFINYFYDPTKRAAGSSTNTRQECQTVGSWEQYTEAGEAALYGNFYSSRYDWREEISEQTSRTSYSARKVGTYNIAAATDFFSRCIVVSNVTVFHVDYESNTTEGRGLQISVALPLNDRNAYYIAKHESATRTSKTKGAYNEAFGGPKVHYYELYNFVFHWVGGCGQPKGNGECIAKKVGEDIVPSCLSGPEPDDMYYAVCPGGGFTYQIAQLTVVASWGNGVIGSARWPDLTVPSEWSQTTYSNTAVQEYEIKLVTDSDSGDITTKTKRVTGTDPDTGQPVDFYSLDMSSWWWIASPQEDGSVAYIADTHSCLGSNVLNYMDDIHGNPKSLGGPLNMHGSTSTCYTGVIE